MKVVILLSGGIDSTACLHLYLQRKAEIECLNIDYGQASSGKEKQAAKEIASHFQVPLRFIKSSGMSIINPGKILGRNLFLISSALMSFTHEQGVIVIGIHNGTEYEDCSPAFLEAANHMLDIYSGGSITLNAPFINFTKKQVFNYVKENNIPVEITYSCELGRKQPCGLCMSCKDLEALHAG